MDGENEDVVVMRGDVTVLETNSIGEIANTAPKTRRKGHAGTVEDGFFDGELIPSLFR